MTVTSLSPKVTLPIYFMPTSKQAILSKKFVEFKDDPLCSGVICSCSHGKKLHVLCMHMWVKKKRYNLLGRSLDCSITMCFCRRRRAAAAAYLYCHKTSSRQCQPNSKWPTSTLLSHSNNAFFTSKHVQGLM